MQDHSEAKNHLDLLLRWLKYNYKEGAFLWRMEYQQRGAIHFHIIAFNVHRVEIEKVTKYWQELTGDDSYPDVETMHNRRKAVYYVSKYVAKRESNNPSGFINEPYSEKPQFFGRFLGRGQSQIIAPGRENDHVFERGRESISRYAQVCAQTLSASLAPLARLHTACR